MKPITNYHLLEVKYIGPTNSRGSRVRITSKRFKQSITVPFDYTYNNSTDIARAALERLGFKVVGQAEWEPADFLLSTTFEGPQDALKVMKGQRRR